MRRRRSAGLALLGLTTSLGLAASPAAWAAGAQTGAATGTRAAAAAAPTTVLSSDFEDGSSAPWTQNGDASLSVVDLGGNKALKVSGRAHDYDGIKTPANLLKGGVEYTFSLKVRLADGTTGGPAGVRMVVEPAYTWVGNTTMSTGAWTTVTGTYTAPADADPATLRAYIGTADLAGPYDYLVDDVLITAPPSAPQDTTVASEDFEDGSFAPWTQSGGPSLSVVDVDGSKALQVAGRANDYDGISSPTGLLVPGAQYTFSMKARLAPGTAGSAGVRFVVKPDYTWVGDTTMTADAWTTVTGTFTAPAGADPAALQAYIGTGDLGAPYTYLVDDIVITGQAAGGGDVPWTPTPDPDFVPGGAVNPTTTPLAAARGTGNVVAMTHDDGPNPGETEALLDFYKAHGIHATFCVIGQNIQAPGGAEILKRIVAEGHTLCNHTTTYDDMGSWTQSRVEADLKANLKIIRDALGNPNQKVPYFRAPNGSWGKTGEVAVALGEQPLNLGNVISDWDGNDLSEATLTANLRKAMQPGAVVLVHDGGGNRENGIKAVQTVVTEKLAQGWTFTLPQGGVPGGETVLSTDFENGLGGWAPRGDAQGDPTVAVTDTEAHGGTHAALVSGRTSQGDGIGHDVTGLLTPGVTYEISAWVKFAAGSPSGNVWLSMQRTNAGTDTYDTVGQFTGVTSGQWQQVTATYQMPAADSARLYFETAYPDGSTAPFLVDDVVVKSQATKEIQNLTPLKSTVDFPVGVAIDSRETQGAAGQLNTRHFDQLTPENHMKPEAWYDADRNFRINPEAKTLMDFAQKEHIRVYGHTLVWHSQTPAWFFQHADGTPLTTSAADKQVLRDRMRTHIDNVAKALSTGGGYGLFGSSTNPVVAFDVVNEVVSDSSDYADGLRRSEWYRVLGEEFIDDAFSYADQAFNSTYAAPGTTRPVTLDINDYNTEQDGKQQRLHALVARLIARGVKVDSVGHQFHVSLATPVSSLEKAIVAFEDLPVKQVVSEFDVTTGTPVTQARLIDQGYYYRDAFRMFRAHAKSIFSVTVWGLTDGRSWRVDNGAPLLFDDDLQAKPAFFGAIDGDLPAQQRAADVFQGSIPLGAAATRSPQWARLPLHPVGANASFQLRWEADHLTAYVTVKDASVQAADGLRFVVGGTTYTLGRNGSGSVQGVVTEVPGGYAVVAHLPVRAALGDQVQFDVQVIDGTSTSGWNSPGALGTLTLVEPLSYTTVVEAPTAPAVDGTVDAAWAKATSVSTDKLISGSAGATAKVRTLWKGSTLYVLAEVKDPVLDATGSDPWTQDSVELFVDSGNVKNGPYRYDDTQIRINYNNVVSFGTGDEGFQRGRLTSATKVVPGGYVVEAAVSLLEAGGLGTFQGLDFQVNDASGGARTGIQAWADPTGQGYQTTARWGVGELVPAPLPSVATLTPVLDRLVGTGDVNKSTARDLADLLAKASAAEKAGNTAGILTALGDLRTAVTGAKASKISAAGKAGLLSALEPWLSPLAGLSQLRYSVSVLADSGQIVKSTADDLRQRVAAVAAAPAAQQHALLQSLRTEVSGLKAAKASATARQQLLDSIDVLLAG
ncbi:endo-1,4-beta-xylanase [Motilibacter peucedani]|uniref:Beta-xylanase n=1 Tax=Motilibacter peucedani TaxID=598650 RepID=A0A420XNM9_9ACTN|nr:endo-1,4-beta-xylanase [Motilibacter peucedani]RKS73799.1 endo-1,4-beta-xylanase [Motilibacter peucedani]